MIDCTESRTRALGLVRVGGLETGLRWLRASRSAPNKATGWMPWRRSWRN